MLLPIVADNCASARISQTKATLPGVLAISTAKRLDGMVDIHVRL